MHKLGAILAQQGAYAWLTKTPRSRYNGIFLRSGRELLRVIEHVGFLDHAEDIVFCGDHLEIELPEGTARLFFQTTTTCVITFPEKHSFDIVLDCKQMYDDREWGRNYTLEHNEAYTCIRYQKTNDPKEPTGPSYQCWIRLSGKEFHFDPIQRFTPRKYEYDKERASPPYERWGYTAGKVTCKTLTIKLLDARKEVHTWRKAEHAPTKSVQPLHHALHSFLVGYDSFAAGYPWFYETWTRDELITTGALIAYNEYELAWNVLRKYIPLLENSCVFPSKLPHSDLGAADGLGWFCMRVEQLLLQGNAFFDDRTKQKLAFAVGKALDNLYLARGDTGLIENKPLETWMDTAYNGDTREGFCLEIQALTIACHRLYERLAGCQDTRKTLLLEKTRASFIKDDNLLDRLNDGSIRPNLAIAHYVAPELFPPAEWQKFFDHALANLLTPWGGITTLQPDHILFCKEHTGQNNRSYHRGDVWFWINHLFALALLRLDAKKYKVQIQKIKEATKTACVDGVDGYIPEISSASRPQPLGCPAQAWSLATYIELLKELDHGPTHHS